MILGLVLALAAFQDAQPSADPQARLVQRALAASSGASDESLVEVLGEAPFRGLRLVHESLGRASGGDDSALKLARTLAEALAELDGAARESVARFEAPGGRELRAQYDRAFFEGVQLLVEQPGAAAEAAVTALEWATRAHEPFLRVEATRLLSDALVRAGRLSAAERVILEAPEVETLGLHDVVGELAQRRAEIAWGAGRLEDALRHYEQTLETAQLIGDGRRELDARSGIAAARCALGTDSEAMLALGQARELAHALADEPRLDWIERLAASFDASRGRYGSAIEVLQQVIERQEARTDPSALQTLVELGALCSEMGRIPDAVAALERVLASSSPGDPVRIEALLTLALAHYDAGYPEDALARLEGAPEEGEVGARALQIRGMALAAKGRHLEALAALRSSANLRPVDEDPFGRALSLTGAADSLAELGRTKEASAVYTEALQAGERTASVEATWRAHAGRGRVLESSDKAAARDAYDQAIEQLETIRSNLGAPALRKRYLGDKLDLYRRAALLALSQSRLEEAWRYAELAKARTLLELGERERGSSETSVVGSKSTSSPWVDDLGSRLAWVEIQLRDASADERTRLIEQRESLRVEHERVRLRAELENPIEADLTGRRAPTTIGTVVGALGPGVGVVQYVIGPAGSGAVVLTPDDVRGVGLGVSSQRIDVLVDRVLAPMDDLARGWTDAANLAFDVRAARELHQLLIEPLQLDGCEEVWFIPDGALRRLPFGLLVSAWEPHRIDPERLYAQYAGCRFLAEDLAIGSLPTAGLVTRVHELPSDLLPVVVADPRRTGSQANLRCEIEIGALREELEHAYYLVGRDAHEGKVVEYLPHASSIHFVTHGELDDRRPDYSRLALAPSGGTDGWLHAYEIEGLRLSAELVVLSACETAGHVGRGEGRLGLARAFLVAGARDVVASSWKVEGDATSALMAAFVRERDRGARVAQALRSAQLSVARAGAPGVSWRHPFFWAAFEVVGRP